ncbi:MAG: cobalt ECF transporter T component CbiQ [Terriglobia bacterium]
MAWTSRRRKHPRRLRGFIERTLAAFARAMEHALDAETHARAGGLLQRVDPRVKVPAILALTVAAAMARRLWVILALFAIAVLMAALSRLPLRLLASRVWVVVLLFTGLIALPAPFLTPGRVVWLVPGLRWPVTAQGLASAAYLVTRVETAATFSALLILSTQWSRVLKALRVLRAPIVLVVILGMTYRYLFLLLQTAKDMFEARQSRMVGELGAAERRRVAAASVGVLISKSLQLSSDVYGAMQSRGFRGEVYLLDDFGGWPRGGTTWAMLIVFCMLTAAGFWLGQ